MKQFFNLFCCVVVAVVVSSCGATSHSHVSTYEPDSRVRIRMSDLELLGETEVSISYDVYLGIFHHINDINGVEYNPNDERVRTEIDGIHGMLQRATYKVVEQCPGAAFYMPVYQTTSHRGFFTGREVVRRAVIRAYGIRRQPNGATAGQK